MYPVMGINMVARCILTSWIYLAIFSSIIIITIYNFFSSFLIVTKNEIWCQSYLAKIKGATSNILVFETAEQHFTTRKPRHLCSICVYSHVFIMHSMGQFCLYNSNYSHNKITCIKRSFITLLWWHVLVIIMWETC